MRSRSRGITFAGILVAGAGVAGVSAAGVSVARADTNQAPIAVPLIGTQEKASLYLSVINVVARGGLGQTGQVRVVLHAVTHPCPEDLSIQLVHDGKAYRRVLFAQRASPRCHDQRFHHGCVSG